MDSIQAETAPAEKPSWAERSRPAGDKPQPAEGAAAAAHQPNESTLKNMAALQKFLDEKFPVDLEYTMPIIVHDKDGHHPEDYKEPEKRAERQAQFALRKEQNIKLHAAFARYKESACSPNMLFEYVQKHKAEGFSPEEISILINYLSLRTNPTLGDLFFKDGLLHNNDLHTIWLQGNINDEAGGGVMDKKARRLDPHVELQYNSFGTWRRMFPHENFTIADDICTYAIVKQLLIFRKEGIRFDEKMTPDVLGRAPRWQDTVKQCEAFNELCHDRGLILPHRVRETWLKTRPKDYERLLFTGKEILGGKKTEVLAGTRVHGSKLNDPYGPFRFGYTNAEEEFNTALRFVATIPDTAADYAIKTLEQQSLGPKTNDVITTLDEHLAPLTQRDDPQAETLRKILGNIKETLKKQDGGLRPYDAATMLKHELALLTREANADKGSHIDAYRQLVQAYLGYIDPKKLGKKEYEREVQRAKLYANIHVSDDEGVEGSHADLARDLFMTIAHSAVGNHKDVSDTKIAPMLTDAFNYVLDESYLHLQHAHMEETVRQMEQARAKAMAAVKISKTGEWSHSPFIKPKAENPALTLARQLNPKIRFDAWVQKVGTGMMSGIGGL